MNQTFESNSIQIRDFIVSSLKSINALDVFLKLNPRKYRYREYITIIEDVLFHFKPNFHIIIRMFLAILLLLKLTSMKILLYAGYLLYPV